MKGRLKLTLLSGGSYSMKLIFWKSAAQKDTSDGLQLKPFSWCRIRLENSPRTKKSIWIENWISVLMHLCIPSSSWISPSNHTLCVPFLFLPACLSNAVLHSESTFFKISCISMRANTVETSPPVNHGQSFKLSRHSDCSFPFSLHLNRSACCGCAEVMSMGTGVLPSVLSIHTSS